MSRTKIQESRVAPAARKPLSNPPSSSGTTFNIWKSFNNSISGFNLIESKKKHLSDVIFVQHHWNLFLANVSEEVILYLYLH